MQCEVTIEFRLHCERENNVYVGRSNSVVARLTEERVSDEHVAL